MRIRRVIFGAVALAAAFLLAGTGRVWADAIPGLTRAIGATLVVHSTDETETFLGSAFLWGDGHIALTCAHVVYGEAEVSVIFADGHEETARVLARDPARDVAVLAVPGGEDHGLSPAPGPAELGQTVYAVGAPLGVEFTVTRGMASARPRQLNPSVPIRLVQHDAAVNNGNSGGPLVDREGRVLGMNSQIVDGSPNFIGLSFAISVADLQHIVPRLLAGTLQPVPVLGLRVRPVDGEIALALGVPRQGELVDGVSPEGIAAHAGLTAGDIVTEIDHTALTRPGDIAFLLESAAPQGKALATVLRGHGKTMLVLDLGTPVHRALADVPARPTAFAVADLGLSLDDQGRITDLPANRVAKLARLKEGEAVLAVNGAPLATPQDVAAFRAMTLTAPILLLVLGEDGTTRHVILDPWNPGFDPLMAMGVGAGPNVVSF
jgi:serine protease Do